MVLDIVHPSLYCYVRGISEIRMEQHLDLEDTTWWHSFKEKQITISLNKQKEVKKMNQKRQRHDSEANEELLAQSPRKRWCPYIMSSLRDFPFNLIRTMTSKARQTMQLAINNSVTMSIVQRYQAATQSDFSRDYMWLPAEFDVSPQGDVKILSYITGIHPLKHKALYQDISSIFQRFLPLFENTLTMYANPFPERTDTRCPQFIEDWDGPHRVPKLKEFHSILGKKKEEKKGCFRINLKGRRLQVIVKIASIELTPRNSIYPGGSWHVEGMRNENIVATGIYYYSQENVSESTLSFRRSISDPDYEQNDERGVWEVYGLRPDQAMNEGLGSVKCSTGRALVFPNLYQHKVSKFKLLDPSKPGHRKILVFWLVNPYQPVTMSTCRVPPSNTEWLLEHADKIVRHATELPVNIRNIIFSYHSHFGHGMTLEEAKRHRLALMEERSSYKINNEDVFEREFNLCEH
mmetsp:Transcript_40464/g.64987  ORF Transcript_40464/g.64987 Transcript_40464/m.64987 type:complete len:463 (-) Transcript_40464:130-1518(-)